jgi:hypothetical protein
MRRVRHGVWWRSLGYKPTSLAYLPRSAFHWQLVRSTKKMASIAARSGTRGL